MLRNVKVILERYISSIVTYNTNKKNNRDYSVWVFGEWFGSKCMDNVLVFANYVASLKKNYKLYWICDSTCNTQKLDPSICIIEKDTPEAIRLLKKAGIAVMNQGYDDFSKLGNNYLGNAITVNLWHAVLWK